MATYYSLRDGLITDTSTYGSSISSVEKTTNTSAYTLTTRDSWSPVLSSSNTDVIDSIAVHLSSRAANPVGVLSATIASFAGSVVKTNITSSTDAPVGAYSSLTFDGTSTLNIPASPNVNLLNGDFTIEFWIKIPFTGNGYGVRILTSGSSNNTNSLQLILGNSNSNSSYLSLLAGPTTTFWVNNTTTIVNDNQWHHIAITREVASLRLFIDGLQVGATYTGAAVLSNGESQGMFVGSLGGLNSFAKMSLSNLRVIKGTALYTSNFSTTIPSAPLDVIIGTTFLYKEPYINAYENESSLNNLVNSTYPISSFTPFDGSNNLIANYPLNWQLLKLSAPFTNSSGLFSLNLKTSNPDQLSLMGASTISGVDYDRMAVLGYANIVDSSRSLTKTGTTLSAGSPYAAGVDGSIVFANSNFVTFTNPDQFYGGTGDFTFETWLYTGDISFTIFSVGGGTDRFSVGFNLDHNGQGLGVWRTGIGTIGSTGVTDTRVTAVTSSTWKHIAVTRKNTVFRYFIDGELISTVNSNHSFTPSTISYIGRDGQTNGFYYTGFISNLRFIEKEALYTSSFTPVRSPLNTYYNFEYGSYTSILYKSPYSTTYLSYIRDVHNLHIGGNIDGFSTQNRVVTAKTSILDNVYVHKNGLLAFPETSVSLTINGENGLQITSEGTVQIGTSANPVPKDTTHTIVLSNTQIDVHNGGNLNVYGYQKLTTTNLVSSHGIGSRTFTTTNNVSSDWNVGDTLLFKPNLSSRNSFDVLTLSSFVSSDVFTTNSNSLCTHTGSDEYAFIPDVYNLNRNVIIRGMNPTTRGVIRTIDAAKTNLNYAQLSNFGINTLSTPNKNGLFVSNNSNGFTKLSSNTFLNDTTSNNILVGNDNQYSVYFGGADAFAAPNNAGYCTLNADFTIECWVYKANTAAVVNAIASCYTTWSSSNAYYLWITATNQIAFAANNNATDSLTHQTVMIPFTWYHVAVVRKSGVITIYVDGVPSTTTVTSNATYSNAAVLTIGKNGHATGSFEYLTGYISNFRIIKGVGLYTSKFDPYNIVLPLSNTPNTTILLFQNKNYLVDSSVSNVTLTRPNGNPILVNRFNSIQKCLNLDISDNIFYRSSNNGALNLNYNILSNTIINNNYILSSVGTGLQISNSTGSLNMSNNIIIGSPNYGTFIYNNSLTGTYGALNYNTLRGMLVSGVNVGTIIGGSINSSREGVYVDASTSNLRNVIFQNIIANDNSNVGFKVSGNNLNYLNPITVNINGLTANNNNFDAGFEAYNITGNISSIIANNNYANGIKTSIGNGPTVFDGLTSNTVDNSKFYTRTPYIGTFQTSAFSPNGTNTSAFISGGASLYNFGNTSNVNLAAGNFTIEFWIYPTSTGAILTKDDIFNVSWPSYSIAILTNNRVEFGIGKGALGTSGGTDNYQVIRTANNGINLNQWSHVAAVNSNALNAILLYINGVMTVSATKTAVMGNGTDNLFIGGKSGSSTGFVGNLYNLRITKSVLYTSNFTPSINYALIPNTSLFLTNYNNTYLSYLSTYNPVNIISAYNYNQTIIKNADIFSPIYIQNSVPLSLNNINKLEEFRLENCKLSSVNLPIPLQITTVRPRLEGSYLFDNCNSDIYGLSSLALTGYQLDTYTETGFSVMNENGLSANKFRYLDAGIISYDPSVVCTVGNVASERLQPESSTLKLRSSSKLIPIKKGNAFTISVFVKKSLNYTGAAPRLMLRGNDTLGYSDSVLAVSDAPNDTWELLTATLLPSNNAGIFEIYVDCSGSSGSGTINIDEWDYS